MGTYVIGDVHGCFTQLVNLMKKIETTDTDARYIFVGDLLDRGPDSVKMAQWAVDHITPDGRYRSVCGNHDDLITVWVADALEAAKEDKIPYLYQYGTERLFIKKNAMSLLVDYAKLASTFPLYVEEETDGKKYVVTHGFLPFNYKEIDPFCKDMAVREEFNWDRSAMYNPPRLFSDITIVCGHSPVILPEWRYFHPGCGEGVYVGDGLVNVDTGCFHSGLLGAYRLEDGAIFYNKRCK